MMDYFKLQAYSSRLYKVIEILNNIDYKNLRKIFYNNKKEQEEASFQTWYKSIPSELLKELFTGTDQKDIENGLKDSYSMPFLHFSDDKWAKAYFSIQYNEDKRSYFAQKNSTLITKLSSAITSAEKYAGLQDLSYEEKANLNRIEKFIKLNFHVIEEAEDSLQNIDSISYFPDIKLVMKNNVEDLSNFFDDVNENKDLLHLIEFKIAKCLKKLDQDTIRKIQERIKILWKELKEISLTRDIKITNNQSIKRIFKAYPYKVRKVLGNFDNLQDLINTPDQAFVEIFKLDKGQITQIKNKSKQIIALASESAYPHLNSENLSSKELELLSLIQEYDHYPKNRDEKINSLIKQFKQIQDTVADLMNLAENRKEANLLGNEDYEKWLNLENKIYLSFSSAYKIYQKIKLQEPKKEHNSQRIKKDFQEKNAKYIAIIENLTGEKINFNKISGLPKYIIDKVNQTQVNLNNLKATLRPYQKFAVKYVLTFKHVLLGDEMGLGKTLESLAVANHLYQENRKYTIAISPFSVVTNWKKEIENKTNLPVYIFHGSSGLRSFLKWGAEGGVLLTNYEQCKKIIDLNPNQKIDLVIVDEAQNIKNISAKRTVAVKELLKHSDYKLLMSGTPLENRLPEMNSLITILNPDLGYHLQNNLYMGEKRYKQELSTVYLRRKRVDVLKELPLINMVESWSKFNRDQQEYYDKAVLEGKNGFQKMRRAAFIGEKSEKIAQIKHICKDAISNGEKVLIFSFFKDDVVNKLQKILPNVAERPITGDIRSSKERQEIIDKFSSNPSESVLICQIDAAGLGLNIQAANQVILCEPQMKPSTENQAISRVYRMGQTRNVTVYHLLTENSIDETILNKLQYKQKLFDAYADDSIAAKMMKTVEINKDEKIDRKNIENDIFQIEKDRLAKRRSVLKLDQE